LNGAGGATHSQAFIDITTVGSNFLPGLGEDIADVARFRRVHPPRDSGQLEDFIRNGINAVKELATE
jgi:hypothetical protein